MSGEENRKFRNETRSIRLDIEFSSWCTSMNRNQSSNEREVYFGVYNGSDKSLVCFNGTDGRDIGIAFSYNPDSSMTNYYRISSLRLINQIFVWNERSRYFAEVLIEGSSDVHEGFVIIWTRPLTSKVVTMYGLFVNNKRKTIIRLYIDLSPVEQKVCNKTCSCPYNDHGKTTCWEPGIGAKIC
eukprot:IDg7141t1